MDERLQDRIDEYILGRMSAEERKTFEEELADDIRKQEQFNYTKIVNETVCEHAELKQLMNDFDRVIERERQEEPREVCGIVPEERAVNCSAMPRRKEVAAKPRSRRKIWLWVSGIAAVIVVGIFAVRPFFEHEVEALPYLESEAEAVPGKKPEAEAVPGKKLEAEADPGKKPEAEIDPGKKPEAELAFRGNPNTSTARYGSEFVEIDRMIADKKYSTALAMIEEKEMIMVKLNSSASPTFGSYDKKTIGDSLQEESLNKSEALQRKMDELTWLKAKALRGLGRKDEALQLLDQLRKGDGVYKSRANALYEIILKE